MQIFANHIQSHSPCGISILGDTQNLTEHGPEQPDVTLKLALHWVGLGPHELQWLLITLIILGFYDPVIFGSFKAEFWKAIFSFPADLQWV